MRLAPAAAPHAGCRRGFCAWRDQDAASRVMGPASWARVHPHRRGGGETSMVSGPAHRRSEVAEFQGDGETRLVFARYVEDPAASLYYLPDGHAAHIRAWARQALECPMPSCGDRRLKVVARSRRRDGFSHYGGAGGHSPEGMWHLQAKELLARWARAAARGAQVVTEQESKDRSRRADVMVTWPSGDQVALEVQYAPLSVREWTERHESYARQGIADVWVFGHSPTMLRHQADGGDEPLVLNETHQAVAAAGLPLLWINPEAELIGWAWNQRQPLQAPWDLGRVHFGDGCDETTFAVPATGWSTAAFSCAPLNQCELEPRAGLLTPAAAALQRQLQLADEVDAHRAVTIAARRTHLQEQQRVQHEREAMRRQQRRAWRADQELKRQIAAQRRAERHAALDAQWKTSDLHGKVLERFGNQVPRQFTVDLSEPDGGLTVAAAQWRAHLYGHLFLTPRTDSCLTIDQCVDLLNQRGWVPVKARANVPVRRWLEWLRDFGMVCLVSSSGRPAGGADQVQVLAGIEDMRRRRTEQGALVQREREVARAVRAREVEASRERTDVGPRVRTGLRVRAAPRPRRLTCRVCGTTLAPCLAKSGAHVGC